jgi:ABC-2 type transport system permease protein
VQHRPPCRRGASRSGSPLAGSGSQCCSALVIGIAWAALGVTWGDPIAGSALVVVYALVGCGAGLLVGVIGNDVDRVAAVTPVIGLITAALGGCMMPIEIFPPTMVTIAPRGAPIRALRAWHAVIDGVRLGWRGGRAGGVVGLRRRLALAGAAPAARRLWRAAGGSAAALLQLGWSVTGDVVQPSTIPLIASRSVVNARVGADLGRDEVAVVGSHVHGELGELRQQIEVGGEACDRAVQEHQVLHVQHEDLREAGAVAEQRLGGPLDLADQLIL